MTDRSKTGVLQWDDKESIKMVKIQGKLSEKGAQESFFVTEQKLGLNIFI